MWFTFFGDIAVSFIFLYLPGYLLLSLCGFQKFVRLAVAPIISSVAFYLLAYLYGIIGICCNWASLFLPVVLAAALLVAGKKKLLDVCKGSVRSDNISVVSVDRKMIAIYLLVAVCVTAVFFVRTLDGAASFYQENDNIYHLTLVRDFVNSGVYSLASLLSYPAAWHVLVAMVASVSGGFEVTVAVNAVNAVLLVFVAPLSTLLFLSKVFADNKQLVVWGSVCSLGFASYPWGFLLFGPLYPNLFAYAMLPAAMALFMCSLDPQKIKTRVVWIAAFFVACCSLVFAHPNSVFVGVVILVPYCVSVIFQKRNIGIGRRAFYSGCLLLLVVAIWTALYLSPGFRGVVSFEWASYLSGFQAIVGNLLVSYTKASAPQVFMSLVLLCGVAYSLIKKRYRWLVWSYGILFAMRVIAVSSEGVLKHYLTGFWYTDEFRIAAALAMAGVPLAVLGLYAVGKALIALAGVASRNTIGCSESKGVILALACVFCLVNYIPSFFVNQFGSVVTGFGSVNTMLTNGNSLEENKIGFDKEEIEFSKEVKQIVGNEIVFNFPYDGSAYAYAVVGLNVENRAWYGYEGADEDPDGATLRANLSAVAENGAVQQLLAEKQMRYVLILDLGSTSGAGLYDAACDYELWKGVTSINDSTPSFKTVLSRGDMRLYEIVDAD